MSAAKTAVAGTANPTVRVIPPTSVLGAGGLMGKKMAARLAQVAGGGGPGEVKGCAPC